MGYSVIVHVNDLDNGSFTPVEAELTEIDFIMFDSIFQNFISHLQLHLASDLTGLQFPSAANSKVLTLPLNSDPKNLRLSLASGSKVFQVPQDLSYDYFTYINNAGKRSIVRSDNDLAEFEKTCQRSDRPVHVCLESSRAEESTDDEDEAMYDLTISDVRLEKSIGGGQFGAVSKGFIPKLNKWIALKRINDGSFEDEVGILKRCRACPQIVEYLNTSKEHGVTYIFLEYMDGKSLERYGQLPLDVLGFVNVEIVAALSFMWGIRIWHRDLKPGNFLVNSNGLVKLADFGVSRTLVFSKARTGVGTAAYKAPETFRSSGYTVASDVWSYGVSVAEMALGKQLAFVLNLEDKPDVSGAIINSMPLLMAELIQLDDSCLLEEFVHACLKPKPEDRLQTSKMSDTDFVRKYTPVDHSVIAEFVRSFDIYEE